MHTRARATSAPVEEGIYSKTDRIDARARRFYKFRPTIYRYINTICTTDSWESLNGVNKTLSLAHRTGIVVLWLTMHSPQHIAAVSALIDAAFARCTYQLRMHLNRIAIICDSKCSAEIRMHKPESTNR